MNGFYVGEPDPKVQELNTELYEKCFAEQEKYHEEILKLPPEEIYKRSYENAAREDILVALEEFDLSEEQCNALLSADVDAMQTILELWENTETEYMQDIRDTIERCADNLCDDKREAR